jgi:hypothetical protein
MVFAVFRGPFLFKKYFFSLGGTEPGATRGTFATELACAARKIWL